MHETDSMKGVGFGNVSHPYDPTGWWAFVVPPIVSVRKLMNDFVGEFKPNRKPNPKNTVDSVMQKLLIFF